MNGTSRARPRAKPVYDGWRSQWYGPLVMTPCPGCTSTRPTKKRPSVAIAHCRSPIALRGRGVQRARAPAASLAQHLDALQDADDVEQPDQGQQSHRA
jgi:hypothetical protein